MLEVHTTTAFPALELNSSRIYMLIYLHLFNSSWNCSLFLNINLQIHSFIHSKYAQVPNLPDDILLDAFLTQVPVMKGMISYISSHIQTLSSTSLDSV